MALPLGLRNNNPGNIRPSNPGWFGATGSNGGFVVFDNMVDGIRALARQLLVYHDKYGINTVRQAINRWAPPSDNNDTSQYVTFVCSVLSCHPDDKFDFRNADFLYWMVTAIGEEENGHDSFTQNVSDADINAGVAAALAA